MAAAVDAAEERKALDAKITAVEKELTGATGDEKVALQQRLTALEQRLAAQEQQKLLLQEVVQPNRRRMTPLPHQPRLLLQLLQEVAQH